MALLMAVAGLSIVGGFLASSLYQLFRGGSPVLSTPSGLLFVGILLTVVSPVVAVGVVLFAIRHRDVLEEVFLVHRSGLLLVHFSKTLKAEKDRDIVVAMLTALQSFVQEAFSHGAAKTLRQMDFGDRKILIRQGETTYLAVVLRGHASLALRPRMRYTLEAVEASYGGALADWNGNTDSLAGADDLIREGLLAAGLRGIRQTWLALGTGIVTWFDWRRTLRRRPAAVVPKGASDPRDDAATLLGRPELDRLRAEYRDMIATALEQIQEGRFTLVGVANVYMTLALQKVQRPEMAGWWNAVLQTVREVLRIWPWVPESQAWVLEGVAPPAAAVTPAPVPVEDLLGKVATLPLESEDDIARRTTVGGGLTRPRRSRKRAATKPATHNSRRSSDD